MDRASYMVPAFCPVCDRLMMGSKCVHTYYDYGCCLDCFIGFVEFREEKWKSGWRPTKEEVKAYYRPRPKD